MPSGKRTLEFDVIYLQRQLLAETFSCYLFTPKQETLFLKYNEEKRLLKTREVLRHQKVRDHAYKRHEKDFCNSENILWSVPAWLDDDTVRSLLQEEQNKSKVTRIFHAITFWNRFIAHTISTKRSINQHTLSYRRFGIQIDLNVKYIQLYLISS